MNTKSQAVIILCLVCLCGPTNADGVHFSGLYVPEGLSCEDGAQISEEYGDLRAGYVIYDDEGRKSDDADCAYAQVQALHGTALQIVDLECNSDSAEYGYRRVLAPLQGNKMLVINSPGDGTALPQVLQYCGWVLD